MDASQWVYLFGGVALAAAACGTEPSVPANTTQEELLWCYPVPLEAVLGDVTEEERRQLYSGDENQVHAVNCAAARPDEALGEPLLPMRIDRGKHQIEVEGALEGSGTILVRITNLEPGEWVEHKKIYNSGLAPWTGWMVTMAGSRLSVPAAALFTEGWMDVDQTIASVAQPSGFHASVNAQTNSVYFGEHTGPLPSENYRVATGELMEKTWRFTIPDEGDRLNGGLDVIASHTGRIDPKDPINPGGGGS